MNSTCLSTEALDVDDVKIQSYQDGYLSIMQAELKDDPDPTKEQKEVLKTLFSKLYYDERTVGISRFYQGKQTDVKIDRLVRCPKQKTVSTTHYAVTEEGEQYYIRQVQYPVGVEPPSMDLSLEVIKSKMQVEEVIPDVDG